MNVLAFDFSTSRKGVVVGNRDGLLGCAYHEGGRLCMPWGLVQEALEQARLTLGDIQRLAVGLGPGSYTGVRMSVSIIQGWHLAKGLPCHGFCSLSAMRPLHADEPAKESGWFLIQAQRGDFFGLPVSSAFNPSCDFKAEIQLIPAEKLLKWTSEGGPALYGPGLKKAFPSAMDAYPDPALYLDWTNRSADGDRLETLEPLYIQEPAFLKAGPLRDLTELN